jgi:hypothetical protein
LSVRSERKQRWRRSPVPWERESGIVALSSLHDLLVLWFIHEQCRLVLDFLLYCHVMQFMGVLGSCTALLSLSACAFCIIVFLLDFLLCCCFHYFWS